MAIKLETNNGDFVLVSAVDYSNGQSFYEVYMPGTEDECIHGEYVGDYDPHFDIDEEYDEFIEDFEMWLDENDIVNI